MRKEQTKDSRALATLLSTLRGWHADCSTGVYEGFWVGREFGAEAILSTTDVTSARLCAVLGSGQLLWQLETPSTEMTLCFITEDYRLEDNVVNFNVISVADALRWVRKYIEESR